MDYTEYSQENKLKLKTHLQYATHQCCLLVHYCCSLQYSRNCTHVSLHGPMWIFTKCKCNCSFYKICYLYERGPEVVLKLIPMYPKYKNYNLQYNKRRHRRYDLHSKLFFLMRSKIEIVLKLRIFVFKVLSS